ncbi:MAG TPA: hypothetical protein ENJ82_00895 [Bacteroidetes bacterium]|nr:hypothetical protein [Bacteroidota bacterium]
MNVLHHITQQNNKPQAPVMIAEKTLIEEIGALFSNILRFFVLPASKGVSPAYKLKMQILLVYSLPVLFVFGISGIVLIGIYLCLFELILASVNRGGRIAC